MCAYAFEGSDYKLKADMTSYMYIPPPYFLNILFISMHLLLLMNVILDIICMALPSGEEREASANFKMK